VAAIFIILYVRNATGIERSVAVSLYLSRIQQEIIAEGGTQTSPSVRSVYYYRSRIPLGSWIRILIRNSDPNIVSEGVELAKVRDQVMLEAR
jgi:hypothetical protein